MSTTTTTTTVINTNAPTVKINRAARAALWDALTFENIMSKNGLAAYTKTKRDGTTEEQGATVAEIIRAHRVKGVQSYLPDGNEEKLVMAAVDALLSYDCGESSVAETKKAMDALFMALDSYHCTSKDVAAVMGAVRIYTMGHDSKTDTETLRKRTGRNVFPDVLHAVVCRCYDKRANGEKHAKIAA